MSRPEPTEVPALPTTGSGVRSSAAAAIELAYGLLWECAVDKRTVAGRLIALARRTLLEQLDRDGQARGIAAARTAFAGADSHAVREPSSTRSTVTSEPAR